MKSTRNRLAVALGALLALLSVGASCKVEPQPNEHINCNGIDRVVLDCTSEVSYQGLSGKAGVNIMDVVGLEGSMEEKAIRRVSDQVADFVAMHTRACRDYNACIVDPEQYREQAEDIRKRLMLVPTLTEALKSATSETERLRIIDQLYRGVVPEAERVEEVTFQLAMQIGLEGSLGEGSYSLPPGGMVPTGARLTFFVDVSKDAYVYMFQTTPKGEISVLFPHERIGTRNPLRGGMPVRIPQAPHTFKINETDLGTEQVYLVVSRNPVANLNVALDKVKSGQTSTMADDRLLQNLASVASNEGSSGCKRKRAIVLEEAPPPDAGSCTRPRGIELDAPMPVTGTTGSSPAPSTPGLVVRTDPGDDLIVQVFPFRHVTAEEFIAAGGIAAVKR